MKRFMTELSMAISKRTNMTHVEINQMYNDCNIKRILSVIAEMNDGSIHKFECEDFFFKGNWEDCEEEVI